MILTDAFLWLFAKQKPFCYFILQYLSFISSSRNEGVAYIHYVNGAKAIPVMCKLHSYWISQTRTSKDIFLINYVESFIYTQMFSYYQYFMILKICILVSWKITKRRVPIHKTRKTMTWIPFISLSPTKNQEEQNRLHRTEKFLN